MLCAAILGFPHVEASMSLGRSVFFLLAAGLFPAAPALAAPAPPPPSQAPEAVTAALADLEQAAGAPLEVRRSRINGLVVFLGAPAGHAVPAGAADDPPQARALAFLDAHGKAFGLPGAAAVRVQRVKHDELGLDHVRLRQLHHGI